MLTDGTGLVAILKC